MDYIPVTEEQKKEMLKAIKVNSIKDLFKDIPENLLIKELNLDKGLSEKELIKVVSGLSKKNANSNDYSYFLGAGTYNHFIPSAVSHLAFRSEFYTAYTPYQPEVSQGNLQVIYEWQSFIAELTGQDIANASVYDGATATADAMVMAKIISKRNKVLIAKSLNPEYKKVLKTYAKANDLEIKELGFESNGLISIKELKENLNEETACVILQNPNFFGLIEDLNLIKLIQEKNVLVIVSVAEPVSLGLIKSPGEFNADFVVGEGQSFGVPMSFGGPGAGFFAVKQKHIRFIPGRLSGKTTDSEGKTGFILTLQAREQHIRREKAISNICTNQGLIAVMATIHLALLGKNGLKELAELNLQKAHYAAEKIKEIDGFELIFNALFFNEFAVKTPNIEKVKEKLLQEKIVAGFDLGKEFKELKNCMLFCVTEMNSKKEIDKLVGVLKEIK
ncbi:MAG: aminomethyl-transferring glycine dehydrogenase subunit GcvPA [Candidatus Diapherotrites archaeon]